MNPLSRGGNQSGGSVSTKSKVMPRPLTTALPEPRGLLGEMVLGDEEEVQVAGRGCPVTAEALASAPWLENNIVPRTRWGQCLEVNKIFIVRANSCNHLMNNEIYRLADAGWSRERGLLSALVPALSGHLSESSEDQLLKVVGAYRRSGNKACMRETGQRGQALKVVAP